MCGRYTITAGPEFIAEWFGLDGPVPDYTPSYNVTPGSDVPVITRPADLRTGALMRWGLVPHWSKAPKTRYSLINAKAETLTEKPAWRGPFRHRRCLVPATGFYEWQPTAHGKQPWYIRPAREPLFAFAGLWDYWEGEHLLNSFAIVTVPANAAVAPIHERMPAILAPADYDRWLDPHQTDTDALRALLTSPPPDTLEAYPISTRVNNPRHDSPELIRPLAEDGAPPT